MTAIADASADTSSSFANSSMANSSVTSPNGSVAKTNSSELYLAELLAQRQELPDSVATWLEPLRQTAGDRVRVMSLPTRQDEEWRFTSLTALKATTFGLSEQTLTSVDTWSAPEANGQRLVFVNGRFEPNLSDVSGVPEGVTVANLSMLTAEQQKTLKTHFTIDAKAHGDVFALLNSASMQDMAVVLVAKNCVVEKPIQILFVSATGENPSISHPRCAVVAERSSSVTVVEQFVGSGEQAYLANAVTEVVLAENARVEHCKWQAESNNSFNIATTVIAPVPIAWQV